MSEEDRSTEIRIEARSIRGVDFPEWYSSLSQTDKELYKEILFELSNI